MQHPEPSPVPHQHPVDFNNFLVPPNQFFNQEETAEERLVIKVPFMVANGLPLRRSGRNRTGSVDAPNSQPSGSEYHDSDKSMDDEPQPQDDGGDGDDEPAIVYARTSRGRIIKRKSYRESASEDDGLHNIFEDDVEPNGGVKTKVEDVDDDDDDDEDHQPRRNTRSASRRVLGDFIVSDEENSASRYGLRSKNKKPSPPMTTSSGRVTRQPRRLGDPNRPSRSARSSRRRVVDKDDGYVDEPSSGSADGEGSLVDAPHTSSDIDADAEGEVDLDGEGEPETDGRPYALRQRAKINYAIPPPLEEMKPTKPRSGGGRVGGGRNGHGKNNRGPGWSATGAELSRWMGMAADDSDSDFATRTPRKPFAAAGGVFGGGTVSGGGASMLPGDLVAAAGTPSNLGKIGDSALADADPLGVNTNVTFDEVGGLDDHIHSLKEMTLLPLLYPEVFQRFDLTPPRGVLFHGPPGTGKTLLARALAASCRANGKGISFFMRKGADCLSKWVGEAERQLRLLFEEARNCQPSIIFFDEIDGLAPVRSSKQDQIHASIVSTLLALMDGMDGRGQVIVIGATNRPDAIDPALRRPGRFDREFYFPLPSLEARERILGIMTKKWEGWDGDTGAESVKGLAKLTKGYGGADLRALCTEAALNAIQRRYPQIYQSSDRLLLKPETIGINLRDFMISVKKLVPSSARSSSSSASPLPNQLVPLLADTLEKVKGAINKVLPIGKKRTALEEAQWEEDSEEGALEREMLMQSMETLQVYRPRLILHGPIGMGQGYIGAAALHHLEGYHIQSLDLGSLMGDSTRTVEAGIVQLFVEAKRHQPSVIYIPSLVGWCAAVSETSRSTVRAMLDTLAPTDPILLLAIVDGPFSSLPRDVRAWFGPTRENRVELLQPNEQQREAFFEGILSDIRRPPNRFADGVKRKKRVLEVLPIAPPLEPRQPTAAELAIQEENDQKIVTLLKYRLGPILTELKRKFKRFTKKATEEYDFDIPQPVATQIEIVTTQVSIEAGPNGTVEVTNQQQQQQVVQEGANGPVNGFVPDPEPQAPQPQLYDMDLERMHIDLYKGKYLTPQDFLDDIGKIVHNAGIRMNEDNDRLFKAQAMYTAAQVSIHEFDPQLRLECDRMAARERKRREERRRNKGKGKAPEDAQNAYAPGTRRSARHNGQQLEMTITDPLQIERKMKRQRSEGAAGSPMSGEENGGTIEPPSSKRPKVILSDDDDADPMDIIGPALSQNRPSVVRFANDVQSRDPPEPPDAHASANANADSENMSVDLPLRKPGGFDPFLLNPMSPSEDQFPPTQTTPFQSMWLSGEPEVPSQAPPDPFQSTPNHTLQPPPGSPSPPRNTGEVASLVPPSTVIEEPTLPMEIARSPSPLPEFHVDEILVSKLQIDLRIRTEKLSIEQLEQLRATCLGCIWRHRTEWDRDDLVQEVKGVVDEFLNDVSVDSLDLDSSIGDAY